MKKRNKLKASFLATLFVGVSFSYFIWLSWRKLTDFIGDTNIVWIITGGIVFLAIIFGYFSVDKVAKKFI